MFLLSEPFQCLHLAKSNFTVDVFSSQHTLADDITSQAVRSFSVCAYATLLC